MPANLTRRRWALLRVSRQLWDFGTGKLMTNLPLHQPEPDSCFLYSAQFGVDTHSSVVLAGGSGLHPGVHVMKKSGQVRALPLQPSTTACALTWLLTSG